MHLVSLDFTFHFIISFSLTKFLTEKFYPIMKTYSDSFVMKYFPRIYLKKLHSVRNDVGNIKNNAGLKMLFLFCLNWTFKYTIFIRRVFCFIKVSSLPSSGYQYFYSIRSKNFWNYNCHYLHLKHKVFRKTENFIFMSQHSVFFCFSGINNFLCYFVSDWNLNRNETFSA